jgi:hypothetical protein
MALQFRRGSTGERLGGFVPAIAEPIYDTVAKTLYVGDGITPGGRPAGAAALLGDVGDVVIPSNTNVPLVNIEATGGTLIITSADPHGLVAGDKFFLVSTSQPDQTGEYTAVTIPDTHTIETAGPLVDFPVSSDGGSVRKTGYQLSNGARLEYNASTGTWDAYNPPGVDGALLVYNSGLQIWETTPFKLSELKDVDVTTTPPANGWTLAWETNKWVAQNGTARNAFARGDGGNFTAGSLQGFVFGVYGAGNFATSAVDEPVEINSSALDGGSF